MNGLILIDKPSGISSFGALARVRRRLSDEAGRKIKIGHTGTLDPAATGLLILVVGSYTKRAAEFSKLNKVYEAKIMLGHTSTTADSEGEKIKISDKIPESEEVKKVLESFVGESMQTPPAFSAIKVGGRRSYKLARSGEVVKLEARPIKIGYIEDVIYKYPHISFTVEVSSGTYIRSLAEDIGQKLHTGAYLSALRRVSVGAYHVSDAVAPDEATSENLLQK